MREILFKAKRTDNGEWVEGYLIEDANHSFYITAYNFVPMMPVHERKTTLPIGCKHKDQWVLSVNVPVFEVDAETVCQYTGKKILQNQVTEQEAKEPVMVWQDDLIAIYTVCHDDDGNPVRNKIAVVRVEFDETYQIFYAQCVYGTMQEVAIGCDIEYMDGSQDWPFTFWIEYMENSRSQWWEWEVIGNIHDKED